MAGVSDEPLKTLLQQYADEGEKGSVTAAVLQVMEEMVGRHVDVPSIPVMKKQLLLDVMLQMQAGGHAFDAVPRKQAVANVEAVIADNTDWFVALYKSRASALGACWAIFGSLKTDAPGGGSGAAGGGTANVNALAAAAAAAAVKANQLPTAEDKAKQGRGQQVRNSQLDIDMANPRVITAVQAVMADSSVVEGMEQSYQKLCACHAAVWQTLYMEMKEQTSGTMAHRLHQEREAMMARLEASLQEYLGETAAPGDVDKHARLIASCQLDLNSKMWIVENAHMVDVSEQQTLARQGGRSRSFLVCSKHRSQRRRTVVRCAHSFLRCAMV